MSALERALVSDAQRPPRLGALPTCEEGGKFRDRESASGLRGQHLEHVTVRISKIKAAPAATVVDLHIVERAGAAAISDALGAHAVEDAVKLRLIDLEGIV